MKCEKCEKEMKESGPYMREKKEGEPVYIGPDIIFYCCMNPECENFYKIIKIVKK